MGYEELSRFRIDMINSWDGLPEDNRTLFREMYAHQT